MSHHPMSDLTPLSRRKMRGYSGVLVYSQHRSLPGASPWMLALFCLVAACCAPSMPGSTAAPGTLFIVFEMVIIHAFRQGRHCMHVDEERQFPATIPGCTALHTGTNFIAGSCGSQFWSGSAFFCGHEAWVLWIEDGFVSVLAEPGTFAFPSTAGAGHPVGRDLCNLTGRMVR